MSTNTNTMKPLTQKQIANIKIAIAEHIGWKWDAGRNEWMVWARWKNPKGDLVTRSHWFGIPTLIEQAEVLPNYWDDRKAIHEAVLKIALTHGTDYCMNLRRIVMRDC